VPTRGVGRTCRLYEHQLVLVGPAVAFRGGRSGFGWLRPRLEAIGGKAENSGGTGLGLGQLRPLPHERAADLLRHQADDHGLRRLLV